MPTIIVIWNQELADGPASRLRAELLTASSEILSVTANVHLLKTTKSPQALCDLLIAEAQGLQVFTLDATLREFAVGGPDHGLARWIARRL